MDLEFDVVDLAAVDAPSEGDQAPDFTRPLVTDEYWEDVSLSSLTDEGPALVVFHPMAGSFPAKYLWDELLERELDQYDASVVGVSISTPYAFKQFIRENDYGDRDVQFFSDPANDVARKYDLVHELDGMAGVTEPRPAAFVLGEGRTIEYAWVASEWPEFPEYDELETAFLDVVDA